MARKVKRVILDTNIFISYLIGGTMTSIDNLILDRNIKLIYSSELLKEILDVVQRPKLMKYFSIEDVNLLLDFLEQDAEFVPVVSKIKVCRDPKDDFLLALAYDGNADYLVTGDEDLLEIKVFKKTEILTMKDFLRRF